MSKKVILLCDNDEQFEKAVYHYKDDDVQLVKPYSELDFMDDYAEVWDIREWSTYCQKHDVTLTVM